MEYLSLHTKVRRLGYLKLIIQQYYNNDYLPFNSFNKYFERIAGDKLIQKQLDDYYFLFRKDKKGIIENLGTGVSSEPYIKLAEDLSLITRNNNSYILTKFGKVYKVILERYNKEKSKFKFIEQQRINNPINLFESEDKNSNLFVLNTLDKFIFLKLFIEKDFVYMFSILNVIHEQRQIYLFNDKIKYEYIKKNIDQEIFFNLKKIQNSPIININSKNKVISIENKLLNRKLKIRSYESVIEPRISWLLDLNLLDGSKHIKDILALTEAGESFVKHAKKIIDITSFIENDYVRVFSEMFNFIPKHEKDPEKKIEKYLDYAFVNFKTLAPNRINASQAITYISIMCFMRDGFIVEYKDVKNYIFTIDGNGYTIDWFPSENDGSIKKNKK